MSEDGCQRTEVRGRIRKAEEDIDVKNSIIAVSRPSSGQCVIRYPSSVIRHPLTEIELDWRGAMKIWSLSVIVPVIT